MINILFEDEHLLICEKPADVLSEADGSGRDILSLIAAQTGQQCLLVHRLDRGTGGAMLLAKNKAAAAKLSALIQGREFHKEYLAVVSGVPNEPQGVFKDLLFKDARKNKSYVVTRQRKGVKEASLEYRLLSTDDNGGKPASLVKILLHTGRTHQIRVQFAARKMPLLGDGKYGSTVNGCSTALWSHCIAFRHPGTGEDICVYSHPPKEYPWHLFKIDTDTK